MVELEVDEIGPSLRYATVKVNKTTRSNGFSGFEDSGRGHAESTPANHARSQGEDPWAGEFTTAATGAEPPF